MVGKLSWEVGWNASSLPESPLVTAFLLQTSDLDCFASARQCIKYRKRVIISTDVFKAKGLSHCALSIITCI